MVPGQGLNAPVIGGLPLRGEEAARHALAVVPVVGDAFAASAMPGAVIGTGTGAGVDASVHQIVLLFFDGFFTGTGEVPIQSNAGGLTQGVP